MVWFVNYIPEPIRKIAVGFKDKIVSLFKTSTQNLFGRGKKLSKPKAQNIRNPFVFKKEKKKSNYRFWTLLNRKQKKKKENKIREKKN